MEGHGVVESCHFSDQSFVISEKVTSMGIWKDMKKMRTIVVHNMPFRDPHELWSLASSLLGAFLRAELVVRSFEIVLANQTDIVSHVETQGVRGGT